MVADLLDEGSGDLDSKTFHERLDRRAIELSFSATRDTFRGSLRMLKDTGRSLRPAAVALTSPHFDTADVERIRSQVCPACAARPPTRPRSPAANSSSWRLATIPMAGRPTARSKACQHQVADLKDYVGRVLAKDTLKIAVVGDSMPHLGKLLDQTFGSLPAKAV